MRGMPPDLARRTFTRWAAQVDTLDGYAATDGEEWLWRGRRVVRRRGDTYEGWDYDARLVARQAFGLATLDVTR